jgi:hypothetical protein
MNADPQLPVLKQYDRAWPKHDVTPVVTYAPMSHVLGFAFNDEYYVGQYSCPDVPRRLSGEAIKAIPGGVPMVALCTDIDAVTKHAPDFDRAAWWAAQQPALAQYREQHPGAFIVQSKGGLHIYQRLAAPFQLRQPKDAREWSARYTQHVAAVARLPWVNAKVDDATKDWTRLFRVPWDVRVPDPAALGRIGDPGAVGMVELPAAPAALPGRMKMSEPRWTPDTVEVDPPNLWQVNAALLARIAPGPGKQHAFVTSLGSVLGLHSCWSLGAIRDFVAEVVRVARFENAGDRPRCALDFAQGARSGRPLDESLGWGSLYRACDGPPALIQAELRRLDYYINNTAQIRAGMQKLVTDLQRQHSAASEANHG